MEKISATAVKAFSPPDSRVTFCSFFPGGCTIISIPVSRRSSSWSASTPPYRRRTAGKNLLEFAVYQVKRLQKPAPRCLVDPLDRLLKLKRFFQIIFLAAEEVEAILQLPDTRQLP